MTQEGELLRWGWGQGPEKRGAGMLTPVSLERREPSLQDWGAVHRGQGAPRFPPRAGQTCDDRFTEAEAAAAVPAG